LKTVINGCENWDLSFLALFISTVTSNSVCNEHGLKELRIIKDNMRTKIPDEYLSWIFFIHLNINSPGPVNFLSTISKAYLEDERRGGTPKEIENPNDSTLFLF
jgi:hypothetical protein